MGWTHYNKPLLGTPLDGSEPLSQGLVGLWLMNEGSGDEVFDLSGNGQTLTLTNLSAPFWISGAFGPAINITGDDDYLIGTLKQDNFVGLTFISWSHGIIAGETFPAFCEKGGTAGFLFYGITNGDGVLYINGTQLLVNNYYLTDTDLHCYAVTYNGSIASFYRDGVHIVTAALAEGTCTTSGSLYLYNRSGANRAMRARHDSFQMYDRALSASEIALLYREPFVMFERDDIELWAAATQGVVAGANPKGPLGHPLHGALAGPI